MSVDKWLRIPRADIFPPSHLIKAKAKSGMSPHYLFLWGGLYSS